MTKREIITKWGSMIAESWAKETESGNYKRPKKCNEDYNKFVSDCKNNGYVGVTAEELWQKAVTYAKKLDYTSMCPLQKIRLKVGLSQSQLSNKVGISVRVLQSYESGARDIKKANYEKVKKLADVLDVEPKEII